MKNSPQRIGTFAPLELGDTILATPLYKALRSCYPEARLTLLSQIPNHPVVAGLDVFDSVLDYTTELDLAKEFDLVVLPAMCAEADVRKHFNSCSSVISIDRAYERDVQSPRNKWDGHYSHVLFHKHQVELNMELARQAGYSGPIPSPYCPQGDSSAFEKHKNKTGLFINTPINEFQAAANRQWPLSHWQSLIGLLGSERVLLVGGPTDRPNLEQLAEETGAASLLTASLADFTAVCRNLRALVTTDGGAMHAAATTGVPIISLHGTSSPILLHPWIYPDGKCISILSPNTCSPCQRSYRLQVCESGLTTMDCMQNIRSESVERALNEIENLKPGTCLIMKGQHLMTKQAYLSSWKRAIEFSLNNNMARVALRLTSARVRTPTSRGSDRIVAATRVVDPIATARADTPRHIFFSPHADDVVLSCGGAIHSLVSQGIHVEVIGVFAGIPETSSYSAYARHLHAKWHLPVNPIEERWREDTVAMNEIGITAFERWDYVEAPYRRTTDGRPLYAGNEQITGSPGSEDRELRNLIAQRIRTHLEKLPATTVLYFPLALGDHVDHRMLFDIGLELSAGGAQVRFYEDYPYAEKYKLNGSSNKWRPEIFPVAIEAKSRAACAYASQLRGLGGSPAVLKDRLNAFSASVGNGTPAERYWTLNDHAADRRGRPTGDITAPLVRKKTRLGLRDFGKFLKTFRWHDLDEILPLGNGYCLDVGCGDGRHRQTVEARGYRWLGLDRRDFAAQTLRSDANALPVSAHSVAGVVAWQVFEYLEQPEGVIAEAARVLEPGGVFCGSVSFLEPVHGLTYFNLSSLILERLLRRNGFADIEIKPGLNGFALMLWTWLRRSGIPSADRLAIPLALAMFGPLAGLIFFGSWLAQRLGFGGGHMMEWLSQRAPLEFAGHVMFAARKTNRSAHR